MLFRSTSWGCGGFIYIASSKKLFYFSHAWSQEDRRKAFVMERESTGSMELHGSKLWFDHFGFYCRDMRLLLEMDNKESARSLEAGYSKCIRLYPHIRAIRSMCARYHINLRVRHIMGRSLNLIADHLSHDRIKEAQCLAVKMFGRPMVRSCVT